MGRGGSMEHTNVPRNVGGCPGPISAPCQTAKLSRRLEHRVWHHQVHHSKVHRLFHSLATRKRSNKKRSTVETLVARRETSSEPSGLLLLEHFFTAPATTIKMETQTLTGFAPAVQHEQTCSSSSNVQVSLPGR